jgi:hypothetical protein
VAKRSILLVTYELKGASSLYSDLFNYLKSHEGWNHYLASVWLIDTRKTPEEVVDDMRLHVQPGDRYLVVTFDGSYQGFLPRKFWAWIRRHRAMVDREP